MARNEAGLILYAADLSELRSWVGCASEARFAEAYALILEDEDAGWEGELAPTLERLLRRLVFEGRLYDGLEGDDRYFLTQLLIDLFDEYVDQEALSDELPLSACLDAAAAIPADDPAHRLARWLARGRELGGDGCLWEAGSVDAARPYLGFVTGQEAGTLVEGAARALRLPARGGPRPPARQAGGKRVLEQIRSAAQECARAGLDLVSMV